MSSVKKRLRNCALCNNNVVDPITIQCGNIICRIHVAELLEKTEKARSNPIKCEPRDKEVTIHADGRMTIHNMGISYRIIV